MGNKIFIWMLVSVFYAYQYIVRVMPNVMLKDITSQFKIDYVLYGQFSGSYYLGYCAAHIPIGIALDKYGARLVLPICSFLIALGITPIIFDLGFMSAIIGRFLVGAGSSAAILGLFKVIRMLFSDKDFTKMLSFAVTIGLIGAIYGGMPTGYLAEQMGHRVVCALLASAGVIFAFSIYALLPNTKSEKSPDIFEESKIILSNLKVLGVCFFAGLMVGPMEGFADAWGSGFFKNIYNFDDQTSNYLTSLLYFGFCFGPVLSMISEKTERNIETIGFSGVIMALIFILLCSGTLNYVSITISLFICGILCAYQILAIYQATTYVRPEMASFTTALANMIIMSFGYVFHSLIGVMIDLFRVYGEKCAFTYGISIIPATLFLGSFGFFVIKAKDSDIKKLQLNHQ
ncbi:MAG: MFS transporter [Rickettsiaceae bacterium]|nr:MFS transporter [Rickettsiaceae bacterium]